MYLNCNTCISFRYGSIGTDVLVNQATALGLGTIALTKIISTCGTWDIVHGCRQSGIQPLSGA